MSLAEHPAFTCHRQSGPSFGCRYIANLLTVSTRRGICEIAAKVPVMSNPPSLSFVQSFSRGDVGLDQSDLRFGALRQKTPNPVLSVTVSGQGRGRDMLLESEF